MGNVNDLDKTPGNGDQQRNKEDDLKNENTQPVISVMLAVTVEVKKDGKWLLTAAQGTKVDPHAEVILRQ